MWLSCNRSVLLALVACLTLGVCRAEAANWALKAHAINGDSDGGNGPFRAPTGSSNVDTTGADLYLCLETFYNSSASNINTLTDVGGNTYTYTTAQAASGDGSTGVRWAYKLNPTTSASEHWSVASNGNAVYLGLACAAFSGSNALDGSSVQSGTTTQNPQAGSLGAAGDLVVTGVSDYSASYSSIDSSFAVTDTSAYASGNHMATMFAWQNASAGVGGAVNPKWTLSATPSASAVQAIAFTPSGGGGGPTVAQEMGGIGDHGSMIGQIWSLHALTIGVLLIVVTWALWLLLMIVRAAAAIWAELPRQVRAREVARRAHRDAMLQRWCAESSTPSEQMALIPVKRHGISQ
jgi:hypothetical protein